jgi:hypothetical protein
MEEEEDYTIDADGAATSYRVSQLTLNQSKFQEPSIKTKAK